MNFASPCSRGSMCFTLLLTLLGTTHYLLWATASSPDQWYTRYPAYPPYCSTPAEMTKRAIPEVKDDPRLGTSTLIHTTVLIRHGARTPYTSLDCWEGYESAWDCNLTTYLATPPPQRIQQEEDGYISPEGHSSSSAILFEKRYDAFSDPGDPLSNILNGTCQQGQLLLQGYEQEFRNGKFLRDAYVYSGRNPHNERMKLLDVSLPMETVLKQLYYRVDDDQRTLMSGQVVLRDMIGPELIDNWEKSSGGRPPVLPLHTADRPVDIMDPNERTCERLTEIRERYQNSAEFQDHVGSNETKLLEDFYNRILKRHINTTNNQVIDCLMTTICTDRPLPVEMDDYDRNYTDALPDTKIYTGDLSDTNSSDDDTGDDGESIYGTHLFERFYRYGKAPLVMLYQANDAEYAKVGMAPLWAEIMSHIYAVTNEPANGCCPPVKEEPAKLALYSAHDTTIMPILASLGGKVWDGEWASYASMITLEIHQLGDTADKTLYPSDYGFRLVYNGSILTNRMDGCAWDTEICDIQVLFNRVRPFATRHYDCSRRFPVSQPHEDTMSEVEGIASTPEGAATVVVILLGTYLAGVVSTYFCMRRSRHHRSRQQLHSRRRIKVSTEEVEVDGLTDENNGGDHHDVVVTAAEEGNGYADEETRNYNTIT